MQKRWSKNTRTRPTECEKNETPQKSKRIYSVVISVRSPSRKSEIICKQLRRLLTPDCLSKMEINPKLQDVADVSADLLVKQILYISEHNIMIAPLPNGPTYVFEIVEYEDNFKNYSSELYKDIPFITFNGKSELKQLFKDFGTEETLSKRVLHFHFKNELVYIRHYSFATIDGDDNIVVQLKEIGPRFTLKCLKTDTGVLASTGLKFNRRRWRD